MCMKGGRPPAVVSLSQEEKAVWDRAYSVAYKRACSADFNSRKMARRRELRGDTAESPSSSQGRGHGQGSRGAFPSSDGM